MLLLDTSFILSCAEHKIDLFTELERTTGIAPHYLTKTTDELKGIATGNSKRAETAKLAIAFLKRMTSIPSTGYVDEDILSKTQQGDIVATTDKRLRTLLKQKGIRILIIRQRKYVSEYEGK
ncbi:hypothetical protein HY486_03565 [Candidatus Woesearchaeota archaeon]|nr:hypothetical protein [Candidatus Woesearchaeota archaeon]